MRLLRVLGMFFVVAVVVLAAAWRVGASDRNPRPVRVVAKSHLAALLPRVPFPALLPDPRLAPPLRFFSPGTCLVLGYCSEAPCTVFVSAGSIIATPAVGALTPEPVRSRPLAGACPRGDRGLPGSRVGPLPQAVSAEPYALLSARPAGAISARPAAPLSARR